MLMATRWSHHAGKRHGPTAGPVTRLGGTRELGWRTVQAITVEVDDLCACPHRGRRP